jgi:predicted AAA+ superfamily ATPase
MYKRKIDITAQHNETFFLWGSRQTGKSTLLKERFPDALSVNLLNSRQYAKYSRDPHILHEEVTALSRPPSRIIIDEIQKIPALLDEVHLMIEELKIPFGLCGSSARKVRRGHANLLGGRALRFELFGLVSCEVGADFNLEKFINVGVLPFHYNSKQPRKFLESYIADYLREEIANEGLVRNLPAFSDFLRVAAVGDTEILNYENVARECGVSATTVKGYYEILQDTLLGALVPAYAKRPKRRVIQTPKFYFRNVGVVNTLLKRKLLTPEGELFGKALENWCLHEISAHSAYSESSYDIRYWRLASGIEVDFILGEGTSAIEIKGTDRIREHHLNGLIAFQEEYPEVKERIVVCLEEKERRLGNGILICPVKEFLQRLWRNEIPVE